jgi:hypothetical protein
MAILSRLFGSKYNDEQLVTYARTAVTEDPLISEIAGVTIVSENGLIRLTGRVHRDSERSRIESVIRGSLLNTGQKFDQIVNDIRVNA